MEPLTSRADVESRLRTCAGLLDVRVPLVQAGMGGVAGPRLAAAVSTAGALGTVALYKADGEEAEALIRDTGALTSATFGVNVIPEVAERRLTEQAAAIEVSAGRRVVVNSYGLPPEWFADRIRSAGHTLLVQVGTPEDARSARDLGAAVIALQGVEAGGHLLGSLSLDALLAAALDQDATVPLLAAGGIAAGSDAARAAVRGASGWLCGTMFVATLESDAHPAYKAGIIAATASDTVISERFSIGWPGRRHRVLASAVTGAATAPPAAFVAWTTIAGSRRPVPRGSAAAPTIHTHGAVDEMARYAGTGVDHLDEILSAAQVVRLFETETAAAVGQQAVHDPARPLDAPRGHDHR